MSPAGGSGGGGAAVVPHTIASTGNNGITPSSRPPIDTGTWCTPSHMLAIAPKAPVMSLLAMSSCSSVTAAMMTSATMDGPNATRSSSRAWRVPTGRLSTSWAAPRTAHAREVDARAAQTTTAAGRTVWKTTAAPAPVSSARCCSTAAGRRWGNRWAASEGRPAGPPRIRPSTDHPGSHRRTATDSQGAAVAGACWCCGPG